MRESIDEWFQISRLEVERVFMNLGIWKKKKHASINKTNKASPSFGSRNMATNKMLRCTVHMQSMWINHAEILKCSCACKGTHTFTSDIEWIYKMFVLLCVICKQPLSMCRAFGWSFLAEHKGKRETNILKMNVESLLKYAMHESLLAPYSKLFNGPASYADSQIRDKIENISYLSNGSTLMAFNFCFK